MYDEDCYKHIFIDLDDTLWDFHANARSSLNEIFENRNMKKYFDSFEHYFGIYSEINKVLWEKYGRGEITKEFLSRERFLYPLKTVGVDNAVLADQIGVEYLDMLPTRTALVSGALELLDYLQTKYVLTLVSNGFVEVQYRKLKSAAIDGYFGHVVLSENAKALKPDKRIFEYAMRLNDCDDVSQVIMIGDSLEADIVGAQNAGIDHVWFNPEGLKTSRVVQYEVCGLSEIMSVL